MSFDPSTARPETCKRIFDAMIAAPVGRTITGLDSIQNQVPYFNFTLRKESQKPEDTNFTLHLDPSPRGKRVRAALQQYMPRGTSFDGPFELGALATALYAMARKIDESHVPLTTQMQQFELAEAAGRVAA